MRNSKADSASCSPVVIKVGGSLFDLPDLGSKLGCWLDGMSTKRIVLVPGGGPLVDAIRVLHRRHGFGEDIAHWLAIRAMSINAWFLAAIMEETAEVVQSLEACERLWQQGSVPIFDVHNFLEIDERNQGSLPHSWSVTSDSVAARLALVGKARQLILLKSIAIPETMDWLRAAQLGWVDDHFPTLVARGLEVRAVNFRDWRPLASTISW